MWEAKAAAGRADDLLAHALRHADADAQVFRSADDRVVVIDPSGRGVPDPPADLVERPAHSWPFTRVR
ncbi:hypothetical protein GCM10027265_40830 [Jatrophihabitans fulvus]